MGLSWIEQKTLGLFVKTGGLISRSLYGGWGHLFMLHRVLPQSAIDEFPLNSGLAITPEKLEEYIRTFLSAGYEFISLDQLTTLLSKGKKPATRFIVITLDDGYRDNFIHGLPLFEKYRIPFTVYVTNCFPNNTAFLWWYALENKLSSPGTLEIEHESKPFKYTWCSKEEGNAIYTELAHLIKTVDSPTSRPELRKMLSSAAENSFGNLYTSWDELRELVNHPMITIGGHTMNHYQLSSLDEELAYNEILLSKQELEDQLQQPIRHFAYPYGGLSDATIREYQLAKKAGYETAVLNHPGNVFGSTKDHRLSIPRYSFGQSNSKEELENIQNGIRHFGFNGFKPEYTKDR